MFIELVGTQANGSCVHCLANPQGLGRMAQGLCFLEEELELRDVRQLSWTQSGGLRTDNEDTRLLFKPGASALPRHCPLSQLTGHLYLEPHTEMAEAHGRGTSLLSKRDHTHSQLGSLWIAWALSAEAVIATNQGEEA